MSQENVETMLAVQDAVTRGDWEAAIQLYDPAVELDQSRMPDGNIYHGRDGVWDFYARWFGAWDELDFDFERVFDAGDDVVAVTRMRALGRVTGAEVSMRSADVCTFRAAKIIRQIGYPDAAEALEAVGLEE